MKKKTFSIVSCVVLLIFSCGDDDMQEETDKKSVGIEDGRSMQIASLYDNQISPLQSTHIELLDVLLAESKVFNNDPTTSNLETLKTAWREAFLHWKAMEIYNLGVVQNSFIHTRIHQWPVNTAIIEANIEGEDIIDSGFISSTGANIKGYGAIEYMLYNDVKDAIISQFGSENNGARRSDYLVALIQNVKEQAGALRSLWKESESSFKTNLETGVSGSQNRVVNAFIAALESIKGKKIETALNAESMPQEQFEAYRSQLSKEAISENLTAIFDGYTGNSANGDFFGLEEYTQKVLDRPELDEAIQTAFSKAISDLSAIDGSFENTLQSNRQSIDKFRESVQQLIGIFKTDFSSAGNIVVTFNDNDGD